jgi:outer membrane protein insertion porin family
LFASKDKDYGELSANERFRFLEYHKWRFDIDWYTTIVGKLVLKTSSRIGILGYYNRKIGTSPFERFQVGGDGLNNQQFGFQGVDIISARGYEIADFENNADPSGSGQTPTPIFNKFTMELRYPLSLNPSSTTPSTSNVRWVLACGYSCPCLVSWALTTVWASTSPM